jgi:outer membrane lipoprotein
MLALFAGCASAPFPESAMRSVNRAVTVAELRQNPGGYLGRRVIVGGDIISTQPRAGETEVELLTHPLGSGDEPRRTDQSDGRVLIRTKQFLDPAVYARDRRLTVVGPVTGAEERRIGELPYLYPLIEGEYVKLWPRDPPSTELYRGYPWGWPSYYPGPYPYGPWGPWPYWW